jgi:hypothetical protein
LATGTVLTWQAQKAMQAMGEQAKTAFNENAEFAYKALFDGALSEVTNQTKQVYSLCAAAADASVQERLKASLTVAEDMLKRKGAISLSDETVQWQAINQTTNAKSDVSIPKLLIGTDWAGAKHRSRRGVSGR